MTIDLQSNADNSTALNRRMILSHMLGWVLFILYEISFIHVNSGTTYPLLNYLCYYTLNILLFYVNAHVVLSYATESNRSYVTVPALISIEIAAYLVVKYILDYFLADAHADFFSQLKYIKKFLAMNGYRGM
ncbi:MAG: hypothetical protein JWM28_2008, partial [Chitinophagaceae bacterium]|nr:hypothetical protein [Chitinophagaceae bacterium]